MADKTLLKNPSEIIYRAHDIAVIQTEGSGLLRVVVDHSREFIGNLDASATRAEIQFAVEWIKIGREVGNREGKAALQSTIRLALGMDT